jgi:acyl-coenzyme A synthetase/AMP-(fatty) acid ligase
VPAQVSFVADLPRNATGKIMKPALRAGLAAPAGL